jgi:hypothetical protein
MERETPEPFSRHCCLNGPSVSKNGDSYFLDGPIQKLDSTSVTIPYGVLNRLSCGPCYPVLQVNSRQSHWCNGPEVAFSLCQAAIPEVPKMNVCTLIDTVAQR